MTRNWDRQELIIRTEWGLTIASTRITLYYLMDYINAGYPPESIRDKFNITDEQFSAAISYIEENRDEVEAEYQIVLKIAEENRKYWEERNQELFAKIAKMPPRPGREALWAKLQAQKAKHAALL
ncbi:MAG: DUF433 domain-containing protein [Hormoscilla sp. SP5CHS1]|nr:DUF433 domain-containing protein [Hormoscilla sp. SP5CHS1]